jgi:hypothetical protein
MTDPITFYAEVIRISTMESGAIRVVFDLPENAIMQAAQLMECKRQGAVMDVVADPRAEIIDDEQTEKTEKSRKIHI